MRESNRESATDTCTDVVFAALADDRRRVVLDSLAGVDHPVSLPDLAEQVVERDPDGPDVDRTQLSLHHRHVPKLADAGLIVREDDGIAPTDRARSMTDLLETVSEPSGVAASSEGR